MVPKGFRDTLGLRAGSEVEIVLRDGHVEIEPAAVPMRLEKRDGVVSAHPDSSLPPLTAGEVRDTLERVRR